MAMTPVARMSCEERKAAILQAARRVFAQKGFDGTTTRELAQAAGVSEALLYKHFPSKESLYVAMRSACAKGSGASGFRRIETLEPSTSTLVILVHFMVHHFVDGCGDTEKGAMDRLTVRSLLEEGEFTRLALQGLAEAWLGKFEECLRKAAKEGDLEDVPVSRDLRFWFAHHLAFGLMLHLHPKTPAVDYGFRKEDLVEQAVWFSLLGAGVKHEAIRRNYNPKALALLAE